MVRKIIYIGLVLLIAGGAIGVYLFNKPVQQMDRMKTDVEIASSELLELFEENEENANTLYLDKIIEVTGEVAKVDSGDKMTIYLDAGNPLSQVICQLEDGVTELPEIGDKVTVKGICTGYLMDVVLVRAIIL